MFVTNFEPLEVFIYKKAYLRICSKDFDIYQFDDIHRHISNYSVNKDEELIMSSDHFIEYLKSQNPEEFAEASWDLLFLPQIEKIVSAVMKKAQESFESRHNYFELFGFDFALDEELKLWLLEVNMSPACAERQTWLTTMLDDMADGVAGILNAKIFCQDLEDGIQNTQWYTMPKATHFTLTHNDGSSVTVRNYLQL